MLTIAEAAKLYHIKELTLNRALWEGRLKGVRRGKQWFLLPIDMEEAIGSGKIRVKNA